MRISSLLSSTAFLPVWGADDGGAGGMAGAAAAAAGAGAGAGGAGASGVDGKPAAGAAADGGAAAGAGAWTPPDGLPDDFKGADAGETLSKLLDGYKQLDTRATGLRTELANKGKAPDKPEAYAFKPSDEIAGYFPDPENNPAIAAARNVFHKHGATQQQFEGIINDLYGGMAKDGSLPPPYSPKAELTSYAKAFGLDEKAAGIEVTTNIGFANGLVDQLTGIPEEHKAAVKAEMDVLTGSASGQMLIKALQKRLTDSGIVIAGQGQQQSGAMSADELKTMSGDPRIDPANKNHADPAKRYDPALRKRYDDSYKRLPQQQRAF